MARSDGKWQKKSSHIIPNDNVPIVLRNDYLNFGGITAGDLGFGIRNEAGVIQFKNSAGAWTNMGGGGGGGGHTIEDEGTPLTQRTKLNFVGAGVTVTDDAGDDATVVTIPGGSSSGDVVGPASAVNNNFAAFDTTTGKLIKDSGSKTSDFATAAQGTLAASASQPGHTHVAANITDFASAVAATASVTANTAKNTYPSGDATKVGHITVTQAVNLDTMESDIATNNAKVGITAGQAAAIVTNTAKVGITAGQASDITANNAKITNANHTGEVTGATALTIAANAVTNAKAAQMATKTYKGRTAAGTGNAEDVPVATLKSDLVLVKADVGLANVDNTTDANKPVSTAQQTALNLKQNILAEGAFVNGDKTKLDTYSEANQTANNAKVSNANHTGEVTGSTTLTIANNAVTTAKILDANVTLAKIANIATARLLGRSTAAAGVIEELTVGSGLSLSAGVLSATGGSGGGSFTQGFTSQTSVVVTHNLGAYPVVDVIDSGLAVLIPLNIIHSSVNAFTVTFTASTTGTIIATLGAGTGSMTLAGVQTVTGAKTFNDTTLLLRNVANTFNGSFVNTNTANRVYTLQDRAGTLADNTDLALKADDNAVVKLTGVQTIAGAKTFSTPIATASVATMTATVGGGVPTPPNNTTTFLRGDGTFATPAGGGTSKETKTFTFDGQGSVPAVGSIAYISIPYAATINSWTMLAFDATGAPVSASCVLDLWKDTYANYPPVVADTITASAKPTVTTANRATSTTLTGWTTAIAAGDILAARIDSVSTATKIILFLEITL